MSLMAASSIFMIEPLPNCFSIWESAAANALDLLSSICVCTSSLGCRHLTAGRSWAHTGYCINVHDCETVDRGLSTRKNPLGDITMAKVAFLGLGVMGYPMAGHLLKKGGHDVTVYNRTAAKAQQWAKEYGGKHAATPRDAAKDCDFVMMCALIGEPGAGQLTKMANQICIAGIAQGLAEAVAFAKRNKLEVEKVIGVISKGAAQSWQMENRWKQMDELKAEGFGFATEWMRKDMGICLDQARKSGAALPVAGLVDQFWSHLEARGGKRWDSTAGLGQLLLKD